jgi:hypothetical protein
MKRCPQCNRVETWEFRLRRLSNDSLTRSRQVFFDPKPMRGLHRMLFISTSEDQPSARCAGNCVRRRSIG